LAEHEAHGKGSDYADPDEVRRRVRGILETRQAERRRLEQSWYKPTLFNRGHHWIFFDRLLSGWVQKQLKHWVPTPSTNKFGVAVSSIRANVVRNDPTLLFLPSTNDPDDVAAASVAKPIAEVCWQESGMAREMHRIGYWLAVTGNAFAWTQYDRDQRYGTVEIAYWQCEDCRASALPAAIESAGMKCPGCGSEALSKTQETERFPRGRLVTQCLSPFEVFPYEPDVVWMEDQPGLLIRRRISLRAAKERYPEKAHLIVPDQLTDQGLSYQESLVYISANLDRDLGRTGYSMSRTGPSAERVTEYILLELPTFAGETHYEEGLHAVMFGHQIMESGPLESRHDDGTYFLPVSQYVYDPQGFGFFGKSPTEDLLKKQEDRNITESHFQLCLRRTANAILLKPSGLGIKRFTGMPGEVVEYSGNSPTRARPDRLPGQNPPVSLLGYIQHTDQVFEDLSGQYDVLRGKNPPGISAGYALQILLDRAQSRHSPAFAHIERGHETVVRHHLAYFKRFAGAARIHRAVGRNSQWEIRQFSNADLKGSVDIRVEAGSSVPRSVAAEQIRTEMIAENGWVNMGNSSIRRKVLEIFGRSDLDDPLSRAYVAVQREHDRFLRADYSDERLAELTRMLELAQQANEEAAKDVEVAAMAQQAGEMAPPDFLGKARKLREAAQANLLLAMEACGLVFRETDDHPLSRDEHRDMARGEEYERLPKIAQKLFEMHIRLHQEAITREAAEAQAALAPIMAAGKAGVQVGGPKPGLRKPNMYRPSGPASATLFRQPARGGDGTRAAVPGATP